MWNTRRAGVFQKSIQHYGCALRVFHCTTVPSRCPVNYSIASKCKRSHMSCFSRNMFHSTTRRASACHLVAKVDRFSFSGSRLAWMPLRGSAGVSACTWSSPSSVPNLGSLTAHAGCRFFSTDNSNGSDAKVLQNNDGPVPEERAISEENAVSELNTSVAADKASRCVSEEDGFSDRGINQVFSVEKDSPTETRATGSHRGGSVHLRRHRLSRKSVGRQRLLGQRRIQHGTSAATTSSEDDANSASSSSGIVSDTPLQRFALALYRKPAFPGFYQMLQVPDQQVFDFLVALKANGINEIAGFLTKEDQEKSSNVGVQDTAALRRDAGPISSTDDLYATGTLLTILNTVPHRHLQGGQLVIIPQQRVRLSHQIPFETPPEESSAEAASGSPASIQSNPTTRGEVCEENVLAKDTPLTVAHASSQETAPEGVATITRHSEGNAAAETVSLTSSFENTLPDLGQTTRELRAAFEDTETTQINDYRPAWAEEEVVGSQETAKPGEGVSKTVITPSMKIPVAYPLHSVVVYRCEPEAQCVRFDASESLKALHAETVATLHALLKSSFFYKEHFEQVVKYCNLDYPAKLADLVAAMSFAKRDELQAVLEELDIEKRSALVLALEKKDLHFSQIQNEIKQNVEATIGKDQKKYVLTEQLKYIKQELGLDKDDKHILIEGFKSAVASKELPQDVLKVVEHEIHRLGVLDISSGEFSVCRTYLEWITQLPWGVTTEDNKDVQDAARILDKDHHGLSDVKERLLEFIAVTILRKDIHGKILCLVGPPGIGKTSIARSMAAALNRQFYHFSLSGLCDVAELRGHRRTYIGALPGKFIQALKYSQTMNPVILLDELDKIGKDIRGDPASALLDILDPTQHHAFRDHYLDVPIDLSRVLFICTANTTDHIPGPLLDRMEIIRLAGYVLQEKVNIATHHLIPQVMRETGVGSDQLEIQQDVIEKIAQEYAREAGVRGLLKSLDKIYRKAALQLVRNSMGSKTVSLDNLTNYLGQPSYSLERLYPLTPPGVAMGLAWTELGGATLYVECQGFVASSNEDSDDEDNESYSETTQSTCTPISQRTAGAGHLKITGRLGDVMSESCHIAYSFAKSFVASRAPSNRFLDQAQVHLHVPEGATPKDGPSAGITMATALVSLALNTPVSPNLAMTGELTLKGKVIRIGGVKEKVIAAQRERVATLIFPRQNVQDYEELPQYIKDGLTAHFVDTYQDVFALAFPHVQVTLPTAEKEKATLTCSATKIALTASTEH